MRKVEILAALTALFISIAALPASAVVERVVYEGKLASESGIVIGNWGSGTATESVEDDPIFENSKSVKIVSEGLYSGGRIDFSKPVVVYNEAPTSADYLRLMIHFPETSVNRIPSVKEDGDVFDQPKVSKIRVVFYPEDPDQAPCEVVVPVAVEDQDGWWPIAIPLASIKTSGETKSFKLKRMIVCSDVPDTMFLGEVRTITDSTPITVEPLENPGMPASYDPVPFVAIASGGITPLEYYWDFDKKDGIQADEYGKQLIHVFKKAGDYTVTLTVKDAFGIKKEVSTSVLISVND